MSYTVPLLATERILDESRATARPVTAADIPFAVALHLAALPSGFLVSLGPGALTAYYRGFVGSPHAIALVGELDGTPAGIAIGVTNGRAHQRHAVRRHGWQLASAVTLALLHHPRMAVVFAWSRAGRYARGILRSLLPDTVGSSGTLSAPDDALGALVHLAVSEHARGQGVGSALVNQFVEGARRAGVRRLELVTKDGHVDAQRFYQRLGWQRAERSEFDAKEGLARFVLHLH